MRILVSGDSHGDPNHIRSMVSKVEKFDCDAVFVVGDFGWWPNSARIRRTFLDVCSTLPFPVYFLAGNHEDWDNLDKHIQNPDLIENGFIKVHPNIFYSPTGHIWTWDGIDFMSVGGAFSIDRGFKTKFISWFPQEIITEDDLNTCLDNLLSRGEQKSIDIMLTHDAPSMVDFVLVYNNYINLGIETQINRNYLQQIVNIAKPSRIIHGHWHKGYNLTVDKVKITGLNCNNTPDYYTIVDTKDC